MTEAIRTPPAPPELAIIGGGITGLSAAYYAIQNGHPASAITIYEATPRLGGKIQTAMLGNNAVNKGAEFIDSDHRRLIDLCKRLNLTLEQATDQTQEIFQLSSGETLSGEQFHAQFEPIAARMRADKARLLREPHGKFARGLDNMSMAQYVEYLRSTTPVNSNLNLWQRFTGWFTGAEHVVSADITHSAMMGFSSEVGRLPSEVSAAQFLYEASDVAGSLLQSDCAYRVQGGTENLVHALKKYLEEQGVRIQPNSPVQNISKENGRLAITGNDATTIADRAILALPAYALGEIQGLENLGLPADFQHFLGNTQYSNSLKFTVKTRPTAAMLDSNFFGRGFQAWSDMPGQITFLVNSDALPTQKANEIVHAVLSSYAASQQQPLETIFDQRPGNIVFSNPGKNACYASPRPGEFTSLEQIAPTLEAMAQHNVAIAGTYLPLRTKTSIGLGFMECGIASAERAIELLIPPQHQRSMAVENILQKGPGFGTSQGALR